MRRYGTVMPAERPILIFDSGVGGLSVAGAIRALLPNAPLVYAADSAGFPYGTKPPELIAARVPALLGRLAERHDPALIVIACNTASTIALDGVRAALDLPVVGTVPAIKPAAALSKTRAIAVLGTDATVVQPYVDNLAAQFASDCLVIRHGSAELVELAEAKLRGEDVDRARYRASSRISKEDSSTGPGISIRRRLRPMPVRRPIWSLGVAGAPTLAARPE